MSDDDLLSTTAGRDAFLDQELAELGAGSWAVFVSPGATRTYAIRATATGSRADFSISAKTTGIDVASVEAPGSGPASTWLDNVPLFDPPKKLEDHKLRRTVAFVQAKAETLTALPYVDPIQRLVTASGGWWFYKKKQYAGALTLTLDRMVLGLVKRQAVMVSGTEAGDTTRPSTGVARSEVAILDRITHQGGRTTLWFVRALAYRYVRSTCTVNANVILATHGESIGTEIVGSGDGSAANQVFALRKSPLTWVAAANPRGAESTLELRVNGVSWTEVPTLYDQTPRAQSFELRQGDDGTTTVQFGDGVRGARLPTGQENITARYRTGIGPDGNVRARTLSLLLNPPLGVRSAVNPIAASGGARAEVLANARRNAPLTVLTLDRIVSLQDFEDFTRGFAGVGKVHAQAIWSGQRRVIYLSVADASGSELDPDLPLYQTLLAALSNFSDGSDEIQIGDDDPETGVHRTYIARQFRLEATVGIDARYVLTDVGDTVRSMLADRFAFSARELAQHVTESEILEAIQGVPGVVFARLTRLGDAASPALPEGGVLVAANAEWASSGGVAWLRPAELIVVSPTGIVITSVRP
ncbi:MAG: putative baseplate assembly protein [Deltaproteobacteria bacterium]